MFSNLFSPKETDHSHVVLPMDQAYHRAPEHVEFKPQSDVEIKPKEDGDLSVASNRGFSIDQLRGEILDSDSVQGHGTAYDRMYPSLLPRKSYEGNTYRVSSTAPFHV